MPRFYGPRVYSNVVGFHGRGFIAMSWIPRPRVYSKVHSRFTHDSHICYNWKKYAILRMCSYAGTSPSQGGNHGKRWHWADFGSEWETAKRLAEQTNMIQYGSSLQMLRTDPVVCSDCNIDMRREMQKILRIRNVFCFRILSFQGFRV